MVLLGVPLSMGGILCLGVAVVWLFVWPPKKAATSRAQVFILRWFHPLVWLLLAAAAFIAGFNILGGAETAQVVAGLALLTYLVFMFTLVTAKPK